MAYTLTSRRVSRPQTKLINAREANTPLNMLVSRPKPKVKAKPWIGPLPIEYRMTAVIMVVMFESKIVLKALSNLYQ